MNVWNFTGNLGKDAEVKTSQGGKVYCVFSVAVKSGWGDNEKTTWIGCTIFGKKAEGQLPQYLTKGAQVAISGEAFLDEWQGDNGPQKMLKVNVDKLDLIGGKQQGQEQQSYQQAPQRAPQQQQAPQQAYQQPAPQRAPQRPPQQQQQPSYKQQQGGDDFDSNLPF